MDRYHSRLTIRHSSKLVERLEAAGLVAREHDGEDRRGAFAVLTPHGRELRARTWKVYGRAIDELFDRHLAADETAALRASLLRVIAAARC